MPDLSGRPGRPAGAARRVMRRLSGVRVRSALAAGGVVGIALTVAGVALVLFLQHNLRTGVEASTRQQADQAVGALGEPSGEPPDLVQVTGAPGSMLQVLDPAGALVGSSPTLAGKPTVSALRPAPGQTATDTVPTGVDDDRLLVVAEGVATSRGPLTVLAASSLDQVDQATDAATAAALVGVPLLVLITGVATYVFAGRALAPVEAIRIQVAEVTDRGLHQRVPLPSAHDEVHRLAVTMNAMLRRLEQAQRTQHQFVADASHELRSPLSTIVTSLELADRFGGADPAKLGLLREEANRLARLVDDLLLLARADEQGLAPRRDEVDLDEVVDNEVGRLRSLSHPAVDVHARPVRVLGDRAQLVRLVRNLTDNARRHARQRVQVTLERAGADAVLSVTDDGPGIPPEDRERIFQRFVRLDASRTRAAGGSGLGLAIVREVAAAHGGTVTASQAPAGGALLRVRLPVQADAGASPSANR